MKTVLLDAANSPCVAPARALPAEPPALLVDRDFVAVAPAFLAGQLPCGSEGRDPSAQNGNPLPSGSVRHEASLLRQGDTTRRRLGAPDRTGSPPSWNSTASLATSRPCSRASWRPAGRDPSRLKPSVATQPYSRPTSPASRRSPSGLRSAGRAGQRSCRAF